MIPQRSVTYTTEEMSSCMYKTDFVTCRFTYNRRIIPLSVISFKFYSPFVYLDPTHWNLNVLFKDLLVETMKRCVSSYILRLVSWKVEIKKDGLTLHMEGDLMHIYQMFTIFLMYMVNQEIDSKLFEMVKECHFRYLRNLCIAPSRKQVFIYLHILLEKNKWTPYELEQVHKEITIDGLKAFQKQLISGMYIESDIESYVTFAEISDTIIDQMEYILYSADVKIIHFWEKRRDHYISLDSGGHFQFQKENSTGENSCTLIFYQTSLPLSESVCVVHLLVEMLFQPCYDYLRDERQLGYEVSMQVVDCFGTPGLIILLDGHECDADEAEIYIDSCMKSMKDFLSTMDEKEFIEYKEYIIHSNKPFISLDEFLVGDDYVDEYIFDNYCMFDYARTFLHKLQKDTLVNYYEEIISPITQRKLSIHGLSTKVTKKNIHLNSQSEKNELLKKIIKIDNIPYFKSKRSLC